jgi:hypothetical protein
MTPEQITQKRAHEIYCKHCLRHGLSMPAIVEALNTINWIPIDPDNLPEGGVLCCNKPAKIVRFTEPYKTSKSDRVLFDSRTTSWECTHYAHVNLP